MGKKKKNLGKKEFEFSESYQKRKEKLLEKMFDDKKLSKK